MSNAFYLKYRPQTLEQLIGQETVKKTILSSFQNNKLSHAYLFVGPRGSGKTSTARILAKMVNCEKSTVYGLPSTAKQAEVGSRKSEDITIPCNKCKTCISITDGSNMDLIEIDAASNRGIDDIRSLREKIKLAPTASKKKVYIIDEVHMLTTEAFNALLKTLEEPPSHVLFILATTEGAKIPQTILSRVQKLDFKLATQGELLEALERIVKAETIDIDKEALTFLAKRADGSFRDGVKLLDQIAAMGEKITTKSLEQNLKSGEFQNILNLIKDFNDSALALLNINRQLESGIDAKALTLSLMDIFRNLLLIKNGVGEALVSPNFTSDKYQDLIKASGNFTNQKITSNLDILQKALEKLKFASIPQLPLELAVVEMCSLEQTIDDRKLKVVVEDSKIENREEINIPSSIVKDLSSTIYPPPSSSDSSDISKLKEKWTFVLETIRPFNFSLEALLRSINITECTQNKVLIEVPYSFHQRILEAPKNRDLLESIISDILGRNMGILVSLGNRPVRADDIANIEVAEDDEIIRAAAEIFNSDTVN
ncbi:MAG: DNA polymerase III subunit gamma/tau [Candidatus Daviesbacteria bacterium]|nr:DNA polymerase III subunit gamma/tau [Candidatus Daviesbacteria bacterium]